MAEGEGGASSTSRLDDAQEAVLPPDAPPGHDAWTKVKVDFNHKWPLCIFTHGGTRFQCTVGNAGSERACEVLARACYVRLIDQGASMEDVKRYRDEVYKLLKAARGEEVAVSKKAKQKETSMVDVATSPPVPAGPTVVTEKAAAAAPTDVALAATATGSAAPAQGSPSASKKRPAPDELDLIEDLPAGHPAHDKVNYRASTQTAYFKITRDGVKENMQTTVGASGGEAAAKLFCRLLYVKLVEEGMSKADVLAYRAELYERAKVPGFTTAAADSGNVAATSAASGFGPSFASKKRLAPEKKARHAEGSAVTSSKPPGQPVPDMDEAATIVKLRKAGLLARSLRVEGRSEGKKNSSINGIYAPVPGGYGGRQAYKKVGGEQTRFIFFSSQKGRWKIHKVLDNAAGGGYAWATASSERQFPPNVGWHCFDGPENGYNEDDAVRCTALQPDIQDGVSGGTGGLAEPRAPSSERSGSGRDDSDSDDASASIGSGGDSENADDRSAESAALAAAAGSAAAAAVAGRPIRTGRVCAKMMIRSGIRCECHFQLAQNCPARAIAKVAMS